MATTITMPSLGESVAEGEIGKWLVKIGERVSKDQPLVEILTDKADSEIPASAGGVVTEIFAEEGDTISVGDKLCVIDENAEATVSASESSSDASPESASATSDALASPAVRKAAREAGVDLAGVTGSGDAGRITKDDVARAAQGGPKPAAVHLETPPAPVAQRPAPASTGPITPGQMASSLTGGAFKIPPFVQGAGDEVVPFTRRRRIIADHMVYSKITSPHVVTFAECDLQKTHLLREQHKGAFKREGLNLTFLAFVAAATSRALREYRELNARVLDDAFVKFRDINLGIAVDTPDGLVVPVIKNADQLSIRGVTAAIGAVAAKARDGKLTPDDLANKTFTISNPGRKGNLVGGAIISQPNVGILRLGEIKKRVVVVEKDGQDLMAIHPVMYMALSYDHRIVDGVHANSFLFRINELLEQGDFEL